MTRRRRQAGILVVQEQDKNGLLRGMLVAFAVYALLAVLVEAFR